LKINVQFKMCSYLTGAEGCAQMPGVGVRCVLDAAVHVLDHPVQAAAQVILGPALNVVQI
jgi:hypothetical protein